MPRSNVIRFELTKDDLDCIGCGDPVGAEIARLSYFVFVGSPRVGRQKAVREFTGHAYCESCWKVIEDRITGPAVVVDDPPRVRVLSGLTADVVV